MGLEQGETATSQCHPSQIKKDNSQMAEHGAKIEEFHNRFRDDAPTSLVNIGTGQVAPQSTKSYLLHVLKRGQDDSEKIQLDLQKIISYQLHHTLYCLLIVMELW